MKAAKRIAVLGALLVAAAAAALALRSAPRGDVEAMAPRPVETASARTATSPEPATPDRAPRRRPQVVAKAEPVAARFAELRVVAEETKAPVAGASVEFDGKTVATDADGRARVPLPEAVEDTQALVRAAGFATQVTDVAPSDDGAETPRVVELAAGVEASGVVLDTDGRPLPAARVAVLPCPEDVGTKEILPDFEEMKRLETTSAADGSFRTEGLRLDSKWLLFFTAARHVRTSAVWDPKAPTRVEARLPAAGSIRGVVRGPDGAPAERAEVVATCGTSEDAPSEEATTDAAGAYEIDGLPIGGAWTVVARRDGFVSSLPSECEPTAERPEIKLDLALRPRGKIEILVVDPAGAPVTEVVVRVFGEGADRGWAEFHGTCEGRCDADVSSPGRFRVEALSPVFASGTADVSCAAGEKASVTVRLATGETLEGVVVDDLGGRVARAEVTVEQRSCESLETTREVVADERGVFRAVGLAQGRFRVAAKAAGHDAGELDVSVPSPDEPRIVLRRHGALAVRLRVPGGEREPVNWELEIRRPDGPRLEHRSLPWNGGAAERTLPVGRWIVVLDAPAHALVEREIVVAPGETASIDVLLDAGATLSGRVVDEQGRAVEDAAVSCGGRRVHSDEGGAFEIEHAPIGAPRVVVEADGFLPDDEPRGVAVGGSSIVIRLSKGGVLDGAVEAGGVRVGDDVRAEFVAADGRRRAVPLAGGGFSVPVPAGAGRFIVFRGDVELVAKDVVIRVGETTSVEVELPK